MDPLFKIQIDDDALVNKLRQIVDREKAEHPEDDWASFFHGFYRGVICAGRVLGAMHDDLGKVIEEMRPSRRPS